MENHSVRTLLKAGAVALAMTFCFLCITVIRMTPLEAQAATKVETKKISAVLNDGVIDAGKYLPDNISADDVTWAVSKKSLATVDQKGLVTPLSFGTVKVVARNSDKEKVFQLTLTITSTNAGNAPYNEKEREALKVNKEFELWCKSMGNKDMNSKFAQEKVTNVSELVMYLCYLDFYYGCDYCFCHEGWSTALGAELSLRYGSGVCEDVADVAAYLLKDDYDDIGYVLVLGDYGHVYSYIKQDGIFYVMDFTDLICSDYIRNNEWYRWTYTEGSQYPIIWSGKELSGFKEEALRKADYDDGKSIDETVAAIVGFSSYGNTFRSPTFRSDGWGNHNELKHKILGFEEDLELTVFYINQTKKHKNSTWEIVGIPTKLIPYYLGCYFDTESYEEKITRQVNGISKEIQEMQGYYTLGVPSNHEVLTLGGLMQNNFDISIYISDK